MTHPVQKSQTISSQNQIPSQVPVFKSSNPLFQDTLKMASLAQNASIFSQFWDAVVNCFKSIFSWLFGSETPASSSQDVKAKVQEIAAREQFVWFYKQAENPLTAFMGNFHPCTVQLWGLQFKCAEAAYQAAKFSYDRSLMPQFQNLDGEASYRLARQLSRSWPPGQLALWQGQSLNFMRQIVDAKFTQNPELKELLLATGNAYLVEHLPVKGRDAFWGDDSDGTGQNWLGGILMEERGKLGGTGPVPKNPQYNQFVSSR